MIKTTATFNSTQFLTEDSVFGILSNGKRTMFHSIFNYIPNESLTGLITDDSFIILTHDLQLYHIDSIFGQEGFNKEECTVVGFQDSFMLFSNDKTIIYWEILSFQK